MIGPPPAQRLAGRLGLRAAVVAVMAALAMLPQVMSISALRSEPAHAATSGITLRAGENLTLAGHAFTVTRIGRYDDQACRRYSDRIRCRRRHGMENRVLHAIVASKRNRHDERNRNDG